MAKTFSLSFAIQDDAKAQELLDDFCARRGYDPASGLTQMQFWRKELIEITKQVWREQKRLRMQQAGNQAIDQDIEGSIG